MAKYYFHTIIWQKAKSSKAFANLNNKVKEKNLSKHLKENLKLGDNENKS